MYILGLCSNWLSHIQSWDTWCTDYINHTTKSTSPLPGLFVKIIIFKSIISILKNEASITFVQSYNKHIQIKTNNTSYCTEITVQHWKQTFSWVQKYYERNDFYKDLSLTWKTRKFLALIRIPSFSSSSLYSGRPTTLLLMRYSEEEPVAD